MPNEMRSNSIDILKAALREHSAPAHVDRGVALPFQVPLALGRVHEWYVDGGGAAGVSAGSAGQGDAPLCLFAEIARRALASRRLARVAWVGRESCPYPRHLGEACTASVVVDAPARDLAGRLWAIDLLLRSSTPMLVIAIAQRMTLAQTRRLQLAAGSGHGLCLLARPMRELTSLSAAATRWRVQPIPTLAGRPRWTVTLLRDKDHPERMEALREWMMELDGATGFVHLPAVAGDRSAAAAREAS